ncbi:hypothetical protein VL15_37900 [Burkholderia cepacia]|uniref:Uncharacterized protein n=1 Tax=Burkholderia cepacia TaxID=292 RepID=A0A0J5W1V2_BURCE|nr:hypothetical protein VL15_37900 [Burkholderia cepacia]
MFPQGAGELIGLHQHVSDICQTGGVAVKVPLRERLFVTRIRLGVGLPHYLACVVLGVREQMIAAPFRSNPGSAQ